MPINNRIADFHDEITEWRRTIHQHPGLLYDVEETSALVAEKLKEFWLTTTQKFDGISGLQKS